ncbi:hypothetical protein ACP4OV_008515 [Aristida adscensionis]
MATNVEEAEKAYRLAEDRFLAGDIAGALRVALDGKRHSPSSRALGNALAAYEVHAASAARGGRNWYAVLGVAGAAAGSLTHDAVRARYLRLCLVLHPDKNRSAAAEGAFKLLRQAWEALSALHPPGAAPPPGASSSPPPGAPPRQARDGEWWSSFFGQNGTPMGESDWSSFARSSRRSGEPWFDSKAWKARYARTSGAAYCGHCDPEFVVPESDVHGESHRRCHVCGEPIRPPPGRGRPAAAAAPPPGADAERPPPPPRQPGTGRKEEEVPPPASPPPREAPPPQHRSGRRFPCPGQCPRCEAPFAAQVVSVGMWHLRCKTCSNYTMVHVRSPDNGVAY